MSLHRDLSKLSEATIAACRHGDVPFLTQLRRCSINICWRCGGPPRAEGLAARAAKPVCAVCTWELIEAALWDEETGKLHLKTQPGSERRSCEECGVMLWGQKDEQEWTDNPTEWRLSERRCRP